MEYTSILELLKKYRTEAIFLCISLLSLIISFFISLRVLSEPQKVDSGQDEEGSSAVVKIAPSIEPDESGSSDIAAEISGAVKKPGVYIFSSSARLDDLVHQAEGLSPLADREYFERNFNRARFLNDQEKIHVPSRKEIEQGYFSDITLASGQPDGILGAQEEEQGQSSGKLNLNTATKEELMALPGIGEVTAGKIMDARPFSSFEEVVEKKVIGKAVSEKIAHDVEVK
jgi:competence protein ComEA